MSLTVDLKPVFRNEPIDGPQLDGFTDPEWGTEFLGVLYQDLSETARKSYALIQTPMFVEEFILDHTLDPAMEQFGLEGLRLIDPVCGSGTFLLGAFRRLLNRWRTAEPSTDNWELIRRVLASIHGVDRHPFAVTISRFRLLISAMKAAGADRLPNTLELLMPVATGDSLLDGRNAPNPRLMSMNASDDETYSHFPSEIGLLDAGSYHVVVGNPPYITVKNKAENERYREAYPKVCSGMYALTVPFAQRFFQFARPEDSSGQGAGYIGQLTANSFMKREFGRKLIEDFFPSVDLTNVIDTSGAYIPGHGTPTVILLGRQRPPRGASPVGAVIGIRGEPETPADPASGHVWRSIVDQASDQNGSNGWTQFLWLDRSVLRTFPWNLAAPTTTEILRRMEGGSRLGDRVARIGYFATTGSDDIFTAPPASFRRIHVEKQPLVKVITGSEVRDWIVLPEREAFFPRQDARQPVNIERFPEHLERLWPYRTVMGHRMNHSGGTYFKADRTWYDWHHVTETRDAHPWSIVFPWVATHTHFTLLRDPIFPLHSAPVIRLPKMAWDVDHQQLTALLNSSAVCFWLKQHSQTKGRPASDQPGTGTGEPWTAFYEFTSTRLADLPLPTDRWSADRWSIHAMRLDDLANTLMVTLPAEVIRTCPKLSRQVLADARDRWVRTRETMIALQEELDWEIYDRYGLLPDTGKMMTDGEHVPLVKAGERAFEIVLARKVAAGTAATTWFTRHNLNPLTEVPGHWPSVYQEIVHSRIDAIEADPALCALEQPEYKRRWASEDWDHLLFDALRDWLLDRCETPELWYEQRDGLPHPRPLTIQELSDLLQEDSEVREAASLYAPGKPLNKILQDLVSEHEVPYLAALRLRESGLRKRAEWEKVWDLQRDEDELRRTGNVHAADQQRDSIPVPPKYTASDFLKVAYWRQRGKFDVPNERFVSYPGVGDRDSPLIGWSGWESRERAHVLWRLANEWIPPNSEAVVPLTAGLFELSRWHNRSHSDDQHWIKTFNRALATTDTEGFRTWRPPKSNRGRPRKNS
ncbi:hypothetical protein SAMN05216275_15226 [Streptosporangium canum]|uniref:site-specific DNA-methyltransferase (adenine-specific) n=1 Tax=Streptosporangium canum TaxID=324952 RepID=A0A1I4EUF9_9ACTN|nr:BREX-2 system adenine-specific DNA-methyltransferase PglX [Streptosporangium canum]SFL08156.1 hypothetical protein SAMN05216275_15226 [Streptosporangium canum]